MTFRQKLIAAGGAIAITGAILGGGAIAASAQDADDPTPTATTQDAQDKAATRGLFIEKLASRLGLEQSVLEEALKNARLDVVADQLAAGNITQEQADRATERIEAGEWFGFGPGMHRHQGGPGFGIGGNIEELATFLGTDAATLGEALRSGESLAEVAEANGVSRDELKSFLTAELTERLAEKVADGTISQEEADEKLAEFEARLDERIDATGPVGGPGRHRGFGPRGPMMDGAQPDAEPKSSDVS